MSKKIKYIVCISLVVILMSLGIITLIMGLVPVGSNDAINLPDYIYIYTNNIGGTQNKDVGKIEIHRRGDDATRVNKIFDLLNQGFQQKALTAMFRGELGDGLNFVDNRAEGKNTTINKYKDDIDKITIVFCYDNAQKVEGSDKNYTGYKYVCFTVEDSTEWRDITFGLPSSLNTPESESSSPSLSYQYSFNGKMSTSGLYKYVRSIVERNSN